MIPFGVPSSGKSTIWGLLKQKIDSLPDWTCDSISSDAIRGALTDKKMLEEKGMPRNVAFNKTAKPAGKAYDLELKRILARVKKQGH